MGLLIVGAIVLYALYRAKEGTVTSNVDSSGTATKSSGASLVDDLISSLRGGIQSVATIQDNSIPAVTSGTPQNVQVTEGTAGPTYYPNVGTSIGGEPVRWANHVGDSYATRLAGKYQPQSAVLKVNAGTPPAVNGVIPGAAGIAPIITRRRQATEPGTVPGIYDYGVQPSSHTGKIRIPARHISRR